MELTGEQRIAAPVDRTWVALNDPSTLKACIAGCETIEREEDNVFAVTMAVRIGPVNAKFKGKLRLENIQPPSSYTINFEGQGGVAGFGKGSADVTLSAQEGGTLLKYTARAQVGGKIAQIGSRLIDATARKMADDFFTAFNAQVAGQSQLAPDTAAEVPAEVSAQTATGHAATAGGAAQAGTGSTGQASPPAAKGALPRWLWIALAAAAAAAVAYFGR
jgi:hypothetical protein